MNRRHFLFLFSTATALSTTTGLGERCLFANEAPKTLLRYQFKMGEELHWNVLHTLKMKNVIGGKEENIETRSRAVKIWKTLDVDRQRAAIFEYRVEDIDIHQAQTGLDDVVYNSRRDKTIPPELSNLERKIGVPLARIKIDPQGTTTKQPLREYDGHIEENRIVIPLPDDPVGMGMSWSQLEQVDLLQPNQTVKKFKMRHEFTLEKNQSGLVTIKFATVNFTPLAPKEESQLLKYFSSGTMDLDLGAGHFIRHQATVDRHVVGIQRASDSIHYLARVTECCCGRRACEICNNKPIW